MSSKYVVNVAGDLPRIEKVLGDLGEEAEQQIGILPTWRAAKRELRSWYLNEAAKLRSISEKDYFA